MRRTFLLIPLLVACAKTETQKTDSATMAAPAAATPAPVTEADIAGTWTGTAMAQGTDSVISHWTQVCGGGTCKGTSTESPKDTVTATYTIAGGDSTMGVSQPQTIPGVKGKIIDHWTTHNSAPGKVTGTGMFTLASKPDSVVMRYRFEGTRNP